jgi:IS30 family transposase
VVVEVLVAGRLTFGEREEISRRVDRGEGVREIARALGRAPGSLRPAR